MAWPHEQNFERLFHMLQAFTWIVRPIKMANFFTLAAKEGFRADRNMQSCFFTSALIIWLHPAKNIARLIPCFHDTMSATTLRIVESTEENLFQGGLVSFQDKCCLLTITNTQILFSLETLNILNPRTSHFMLKMLCKLI